MSLAERTRAAVREHPFLLDGLRAGVVNYAAAARFLDVGDEDAVVAALRRFAADLPDYEPPGARVSVRMERGFGLERIDVAGDGDGDVCETAVPLVLGGHALLPDEGSLTLIVARGDVDGPAAAGVLGRLAAADLVVEAAALGRDSLWVVVNGREGPNALRVVEETLSS